MKNFLTISSCTKDELLACLYRALEFKKMIQSKQALPNLNHHAMANLFYENSTRTRVSFELAAQHLKIKTVNLDLAHSSEAKGETIADTVKNIEAMGIDLIVLRHSEDGLPEKLAQQLNTVRLINAGDGMHAHPTQSMLDMMTIIEEKKSLSSLKIAVIGDLKHSRVANSFQAICATMGVGTLMLVGPKAWWPRQVSYGKTSDSLKEGLQDADVIMTLRVQKERFQNTEAMDLSAYREQFALTQDMLSYAKPDAIVMHPGPLNRGIEIDDVVADGAQSRILQQVQNGVFVRMAIIETLLASEAG